MNKFSLVKQLTVGIALFSDLTLLYAATQPTFTLTPTTPTTVQIPVNDNAVVQYRVTNQTKITRTLTMVPIAGITQLTGSAGECSNPFMLASKQSCLLTLQLNGSQLPGQVIQGPEVCKTQSADDNSPTPFLCSQPSQIESLSITRLGVEQAALSVSPSTRTLTACGASSNFTVTNNSSTVTATNILANLTGTALVGNVSQNFSDCTSVLPGQSCTLIFTPECIGAVTLASFPIQGDNTQQVGSSINVVLPGEAPISVTAGSPLTLQGTTGTPVTGTLTVTNNSPILTATNIAADITGALATAGVTQDATNCTTVLRGASCTLTFTPGSQAVSTTSVILQGSNTSQTTATIAVNAAPQASIAITAGSRLTLQSNGSTGTMTIINNSSTERALNIASNFGGTALSGNVSQTGSTCASVNPSASCTLTFTPGSTVVAQTNFPIQGNNTTAATGAITISRSLTTLFSGGNSQAGNIFNVTNLSSRPIIITSFDINLQPGTGQLIVYYLESAATGFETNPAPWRTLGSATVISNGNNVATRLSVGGLTIPAGATYGIYITENASSAPPLNYTNGSNTYADSQLSIQALTGRAYPPFSSSVFRPRQWNGTIYYN